MARHTGNTKAPFRDKIDKPRSDKPQNEDTKAKKPTVTPPKKALSKKAGAANKAVKGSPEAESALLQTKQRSTVKKGRRDSDKENVHAVSQPVIQERPVDPWTLSFDDNVFCNPDAWYAEAVDAAVFVFKHRKQHKSNLTRDDLGDLVAYADTGGLLTVTNHGKKRLRELYRTLSPAQRRLVYEEANFMYRATKIEAAEAAHISKIRKLKRRHSNFESIRYAPTSELSFGEVQLQAKVCELEELLKEFPKQEHLQTMEYVEWCGAGTLKRILFKRDMLIIGRALAQNHQKLEDARESRGVKKSTKKLVQGRRSPSPLYRPGQDHQYEAPGEVEEGEITEQAPPVEQRQMPAKMPEKPKAEAKQRVEPPKPTRTTNLSADDQYELYMYQRAHRLPTDPTYHWLKGSNKRSGFDADLDDKIVAQGRREAKKARLEFEEEAARPPRQFKGKINLAEYRKRGYENATRRLNEQQIAEQWKVLEQQSKDQTGSTWLQTANEVPNVQATDEVEEQPAPKVVQQMEEEPTPVAEETIEKLPVLHEKVAEQSIPQLAEQTEEQPSPTEVNVEGQLGETTEEQPTRNTNATTDDIETVQEPVTTDVEEQQAPAVMQEAGAGEQVAEKTGQRTIEANEVQAAPKVIEKVEKQSAAAVVEGRRTAALEDYTCNGSSVNSRRSSHLNSYTNSPTSCNWWLLLVTVEDDAEDQRRDISCSVLD